ncbi:hypothetical protein [Photobacterium indicum]|uniref:Uncharacterized protein n=1 Tax=Photobacterium indicum TaxID=81447 RepID=A0A2T3L3D3_9GAMM|nr:hypothetical protein [Photobacterium indicum]PSV43606.1 hypothetical protein C9J47_22320 [Photobacterium indicum]
MDEIEYRLEKKFKPKVAEIMVGNTENLPKKLDAVVEMLETAISELNGEEKKVLAGWLDEFKRQKSMIQRIK